MKIINMLYRVGSPPYRGRAHSVILASLLFSLSYHGLFFLIKNYGISISGDGVEWLEGVFDTRPLAAEEKRLITRGSF